MIEEKKEWSGRVVFHHRHPGFQPGSQHARFEGLARTEFETFRCTVFLGPFKGAAFGIAPNALWPATVLKTVVLRGEITSGLPVTR